MGGRKRGWIYVKCHNKELKLDPMVTKGQPQAKLILKGVVSVVFFVFDSHCVCKMIKDMGHPNFSLLLENGRI